MPKYFTSETERLLTKSTIRIIIAIAALFNFFGTDVSAYQAMIPREEPSSIRIPELTKTQMIEDFDYLVKIVDEVFPAVSLNRINFGIDIYQNLEAYRMQIDSTETTESFVKLLNRAINSCHGGHFEIFPLDLNTYEQLGWLRDYYADHVDEETIRLTQTYYKLIRSYSDSVRLNIPLIYYDGQYYLKRDIVYREKRFHRGLRVVRCEGVPIEDIVQQNHDERSILPWDFDNRRYYWTEFYRSVAFQGRESLHFLFDDQDGNMLDGVFRLDEEVVIEAEAEDRRPRVLFFDEHRTLFIRMPAMRIGDIDYYQEEILKIGDQETIKRVIIDIRENGGGSDLVWLKVLGLIIDSMKIEYKVELGLKHSMLAVEYAKRHMYGRTYRRWHPRLIPYLDNENLLMYTERNPIYRDPESIRYSGKIYILVDNIYSSAGSLANVATKNSALVTVGRRNPYILGSGIDPFVFSFPHSKMCFRVSPLIDLTDVKKAEEALHTEVEIAVEPTLEEMIQYYNPAGDRYAEAFLIDTDPFVRKVVGLEKKRIDTLLIIGILLLLGMLSQALQGNFVK